MTKTNPKEKINSPLYGTHLEGGYGHVFAYHLNSASIPIEEKMMLILYGVNSSVCAKEIEGITTFSKETAASIAGCTLNEYYKRRSHLEEKGLISVKKMRDTYSSKNSRSANASTQIRILSKPKGFIEPYDAKLKYGNILTCGYGEIPRKLIMQRKDYALKPADVVIAAYIFANAASIKEYYLSGYRLRMSLFSFDKEGEPVPMTRYAFDASVKRLKKSGWLDFTPLSKLDIRKWRKERFNEDCKGDEHGDFYIVKILNPSLPESGSVDNPKFYTEEDCTEEKYTDENCTEEDCTAINNIYNNTFDLTNEYTQNNSYDHQAFPQSYPLSDDIKNMPEINTLSAKKKGSCPELLRERLGEQKALEELTVLYKVLGQISEERYELLKDRLKNITECLYRIALEGKELEEAALSINAAYLISHRMLETEKVSDIDKYIRVILKNAESDRGFIKAPVEENNGYQAVMDGFRLSDGGRSQREAYITHAEKEPVTEKEIEEYLKELKDWMMRFGFQKEGNIHVFDTPLPVSLTKDKAGRRALVNILYSFVRQDSIERLNRMYGSEKVRDGIIKVQSAMTSLLRSNETYMEEGRMVSRNFISKRLQSAIYIDSEGKLRIKRNIFEKALALYLRSSLERRIMSPVNWLRVLIVNELSFIKDGDVEVILTDVEAPLPSFTEESRKRSEGIFKMDPLGK